MKRFLSSIIIIAVLCFLSYAEKDFNHLTTMNGDSIGDRFIKLSSGGDVNGDGHDDLLIGAPGGNYVKLYYGGSDFDTIPDLVFESKRYDHFGSDITLEGDISSDGYDDVIIGASAYNHGNIYDAGRVNIYFGGPDIDTVSDRELIVANGEESIGWYCYFGSSISCEGDLNNDNHNDLIVSAPNKEPWGKAYIYYGGPNIDSNYDKRLSQGFGPGSEPFGGEIDYVGDINKDSCDDIIIGTCDSHPGRAYLVYGDNSNICLDSATVFKGDTSYSESYFGRYVSGLGDVNGDGYQDIGVIGGDYAEIISGKSLSTAKQIAADTSHYGDFYSITGGKDINGDKIQDFIIGSASADKYGINYGGTANIFAGKNNIESIPDYTIKGKNSLHYFGIEIEYLGDINNDGNIEVAISEIKDLETPGSVYIYTFGEADAIENSSQKNSGYNLEQNYPNPFNSATNIRYFVPSRSKVRVTIYNIIGQKIKTLESTYKNSGSHLTIWKGRDKEGKLVPSGIYYYKLSTLKRALLSAKKMIYLK